MAKATEKRMKKDDLMEEANNDFQSMHCGRRRLLALGQASKHNNLFWPPSPTVQWFETYMKVKYCTGAVVISSHCKTNMFTYINVNHKYTAIHCIISQFHTNTNATAPY